MTDIERYAKEYLGKVFYFCLKKTGNDADADELSSDIGFEVVSSLSRGATPENFDAWVWTIARRRWAKFAAKKYYKTPEQLDISEQENVLFSDDDVERDVILSEDLALLRRELAFVRGDYRKILVAHYVDEMGVKDIAKMLGIPVGTVKTRLQNSRKILKEGMNMARTFGQRSYKPEEISFTASGSQPKGLPWSAVQRKIPKNVLLEASNNPSTIEELSMELGIAVPYMEEEVKILEKSELLKKVEGDKYITNFFISPRECQSEINSICCDYAENQYKRIWEIAKAAAAKANELGALGTVSLNDAEMYFAFKIQQRIQGSAFTQGILVNHFKRADGGTWGFIGYEQGAECRLPDMGVSNNYNNFDGMVLGGYFCHSEKYGEKVYKDFWMDNGTVMLIRKIVSVDFDDKELSDTEKSATLHLSGINMISKNGKNYDINNFIVISRETQAALNDIIAYHPEYAKMKAEMCELVGKGKEIISRYCSDQFKDDFEYYVAMHLDMRGIFANLWKDKGLYTGGHSEFVAFEY